MMKKSTIVLTILSALLLVVLIASCVLLKAAHNKIGLLNDEIFEKGNSVNTSVPKISPVPQSLKDILKPEFFGLFGKSRREIRPKYKMETSESDTSFWYSGLGSMPNGTAGNVFISYNIDGMSYDGLCDYISGEIERISVFKKGTTVADFVKTIKGFVDFSGSDVTGPYYQIDNYIIFADVDSHNKNVITRLTIKDQPV